MPTPPAHSSTPASANNSAQPQASSHPAPSPGASPVAKRPRPNDSEHESNEHAQFNEVNTHNEHPDQTFSPPPPPSSSLPFDPTKPSNNDAYTGMSLPPLTSLPGNTYPSQSGIPQLPSMNVAPQGMPMAGEMGLGMPPQPPQQYQQHQQQQEIPLQVKKLSDSAQAPTRGSAFAAGYDMYASADVVIPGRGKALVSTGLAVAVPVGTYGRIAPRSGLASKHFIDTGAGVIDADYRGEVKVLLFNHAETDFEVKTGDRVAQMVLERIYTPEVIVVEQLEDSVRGAGGFGSTG